MSKKQKKMLKRIIISGVLFIILNILRALVQLPVLAWLVLYLIDYLIIGYDILKKAATNIKNGRVFDECFLMAVATIGAIALALYEKSSDFNEAVAVMLFYQIGELFQSYAVGKSRKNISALMDIRPDYANIIEDGKLVQVDPDTVVVGSEIIVQPGEKIPIDGIVKEGTSMLNTAALTGESVPRKASTGDEVCSGCINESGVLTVVTTKPFGESTVSKILELVEESGARKSRSENFISKFAKVYTPGVCYGALALAIIPPIINIVMGNPAGFSIWIYRALTFLVISCPCALVISVPLSFFAGIGGASKEGILIKGSSFLEALSKVSHVLCDKTGTLTKGVFEVIAVEGAEGFDEATLLDLAAHTEIASSHPVAKSIRDSYGKELDRTRVTSIEEIAGHGLKALVDGKEIACGNIKLMKQLGLQVEAENRGATVVYIAINGAYAGKILISDVVKESSAGAIEKLKKLGVKQIVMLTGDTRSVAEAIANTLGLNGYYSDLLPEDKVSKVEEMLGKKKPTETLAFVGDGINDAPVLMRADIGVAMGAMGSDAAIEAADVVLMDDDPMKLAKAVGIGRKCMRIVYENIAFALIVKFGCLILGALGIANMWYAIFADVGVMVLAVLNAIRCLNTKNA